MVINNIFKTLNKHDCVGPGPNAILLNDEPFNYYIKHIKKPKKTMIKSFTTHFSLKSKTIPR